MSTISTGAVAGFIPGINFTENVPPKDGTSISPVDPAAESDGEQSDTSSYDPATALYIEDVDRNDTLARKRKSLDPDSLTDNWTTKRPRLHEDHRAKVAVDAGLGRARQLPAEIWHHVFTFLPPKSLGRLLAINKLFHSYLNPSPSATTPSCPTTGPSTLLPLKPDAIWQASRRLHWPRMPSPLKDRSELDMWRLTCSTSCQFCGSKGSLPLSEGKLQWHQGPGAEGVSPVFPLFIVTCGDCLSSKGLKEIDVLLSSTFPSILISALPVAFVSKQNEIVPPHLMQTGDIDPQVSITKIFWPNHLEQVKEEFEYVKSLGSAAAEEWLKGLGTRGTQIRTDASRWEKWALFGGIHQMRNLTSSLTSSLQQVGTSSISHVRLVTGSDDSTQHLARPAQSEKIHPQPVMENGIPGLVSGTEPSHQPRSLGQQKRTKVEVVELKAKRRAEIERRALLLDPPLRSDVLAHIPSFQAALQIITPLDDNAWDLLKPRLLAQRKDAELRVEQNLANARVVQGRSRVSSPHPEGTTPTTIPRQVTDADWDETQGPLRARISDYAEEIIRDGWDDGDKVKRKNSPQFAAEVLLYVRKRFYAEVAKDAAAATAAGTEPVVDPPEGPWTQKLTLENMKWVFDFKIKKFTERYRKDLFLCNGCEENYKFYAFEAVVQHYAAKHTSALSVGSVVVHWRAEWPEVPPFKPDPKLPEPASHSQPTPYQASNAVQAHPGLVGFPQGALPGYSAPNYGVPVPHYNYGQQASFVTPNPYALNPYMASYFSHSYSQDAYHHPYQQGPTYNAPNYADQSSGSLTNHPSSAPHALNYESHSTPHDAFPENQPEDTYRVRLNAMARVARGTWNKISCVKDLPSPVKICVVINQTTRKFRNKFSEPIPLPMFIDALSNLKEVRPIRNTNGLTCQACVARYGTEQERKTLSLPQLANHFNKKHVEALASQGNQPMDWQTEMVYLPEYLDMRGLRRLLENNRPAYRLVAETLKWSVDDPSPTNGSGDQSWQPKTQIPFYEDNGQHGTAHPVAVGSRGIENVDMGESGRISASAGLRNREEASSRRVETPRSEVAHRGQVQSVYDSDVPNLRPASVVYSRKKVHEEARRCRPQVASGQDNPGVSNQYSSPEGGGVEQLSRRNALQNDRAQFANDGQMEFDFVRSRQKSLMARETQPDHRERQESMHLNSGPTFREGGVSSERRNADPRQLERPSERTMSNPRPSHSEGGFGLLDALESHLDRAQQDVMYVDPSGRELRKTAHGTFVYRDEPVEEPLPQGRYQRRSPSAQYDHPYRSRAQEPAQRVYYDGPPAEDYELVEVRDPQGSYFIKRPIHREGRDYYAGERSGTPREANGRPAYRSVDQLPRAQESRYAPDPRAPPMVSQRPPPDSEYEEYDPRYPAGGTSGGGGSAHRYRR